MSELFFEESWHHVLETCIPDHHKAIIKIPKNLKEADFKMIREIINLQLDAIWRIENNAVSK